MVDANGDCRPSILHKLRCCCRASQEGTSDWAQVFSVCEGDVLRRLSSSCMALNRGSCKTQSQIAPHNIQFVLCHLRGCVQL